MDQDQVWQAIDSQRTTVARLLESLHDSDWGRPSLRADWTVRDVARVWNSGWPFRAKKRLRGLQLSATDSAWSAGDGIALLRERLADGAR